MKRGRLSWTFRLTRGRLEDVKLAVAAGGTAREIYIAQRLVGMVRYEAFRAWVRRQRKELALRGAPAPAPLSPPVVESLPRARWGTRGVRRLRRQGLALITNENGQLLTAEALLDIGSQLRLFADRLVDIGKALLALRPCRERKGKRAQPRAKDRRVGGPPESLKLVD
jgi:hypothetical protein